LSGTGTRYAYTVIVPIADNQTGSLIHNFYPNQGSAHGARTAALVVTDANFFQRV
jgi:hypothetical protein